MYVCYQLRFMQICLAAEPTQAVDFLLTVSVVLPFVCCLRPMPHALFPIPHCPLPMLLPLPAICATH
ncbi:GL20578 [Drosophila persimilis]|uniref:GL20578 n=1 Tax=Drosophila persimilis TaxID=7234 RepID=B4GYX3_DROPE|nr:GL20578 [Drosophila persimilis]